MDLLHHFQPLHTQIAYSPARAFNAKKLVLIINLCTIYTPISCGCKNDLIDCELCEVNWFIFFLNEKMKMFFLQL